MKVRPQWFVVAALAIALVALYFAEWEEVVEDSGYSTQARKNPYLAAERFLGEFGVLVESADGLALLDELPSFEHVLLIASSRKGMSERRTETLLDWVINGGRLILLATDLWDEDNQASGDVLLDDLGVRLYDTEAGVMNFGGLNAPGEGCAPGEAYTRIELADQEQALAVSLHLARYLDYQGGYEAFHGESPVGSQMLYVNVGSGAIVVLTSLRMWRNSAIACADHAHLLRWLTDDRPVLWWLYNTEMKSLPALLWERFSLAILLMGVLFGLWWWRSSAVVLRRRGSSQTVRRSLLEHVEGSARFRWQQNDPNGLLGALRADVLRDRAGPGRPLTQSDTARLEQLATRAQLTTNAVSDALFGNPGRNTRAFTEAVSVLQKLAQLN